MQTEIDLSALRDGNLHLVAFLGDKFCYIAENPNGSEWVIADTLNNKFPALVFRMLDDRAPIL